MFSRSVYCCFTFKSTSVDVTTLLSTSQGKGRFKISWNLYKEILSWQPQKQQVAFFDEYGGCHVLTGIPCGKNMFKEHITLLLATHLRDKFTRDLGKKYERHNDILGTIGGIWKCTGDTVRKLLIFLAAITVLKLYRGISLSRGMHAEVFRTQVIVVKSEVIQEKKVWGVEREEKCKCGKIWIIEPRWSIYRHSLYVFFNFVWTPSK